MTLPTRLIGTPMRESCLSSLSLTQVSLASLRLLERRSDEWTRELKLWTGVIEEWLERWLLSKVVCERIECAFDSDCGLVLG